MPRLVATGEDVALSDRDHGQFTELELHGVRDRYRGQRFPAVMLAPVDGIAQLVNDVQERNIDVTLDGL